MFDISRHPYFEEYIDEKSGVKSYILKEKVAELQQNFYFSDIGMTYDNKYMWFMCMNWPARIRFLAVMSMDAENPFIRPFYSAGITGCPSVIPGTHDAIFSVGETLYKIDIEGNITKILSVDPEIIGFRPFERLCTHCSINSTGELVVLDMRIGNKSYVGTGNMKTGEVKMIHKFMRHYNHAQFCPTDPELFLIDEDWERDPYSGERFDIDQRMWLMDINGTRLEPVMPQNWFRHNGSIICHDFWSQDGYVCWPDLTDCVYEQNIKTRETTLVWSREICHAHTLDRKLWVGDASPYRWNKAPCRVMFFDRESGKEIEIFSAMPKPKFKSEGVYHLDPHPQFTHDGENIISMTTVKSGEIDLSITPVKPLLEICRECGNQINDPWKK